MKVAVASVITIFIMGGIPIPLPSTSAQSSGCNAHDSRAQLLSTDPVYIDATDLARTLNDRGLEVRCILASKEQHIFEGQKGAAFYRTDDGSFDVLFLPKTESFAPLQIVERREDGRYLYSFRGTPRSLTRMDTPMHNYFIKRENLLFHVWGQEQLAASLRAKFAQ
jgi:hypothetical protein